MRVLKTVSLDANAKSFRVSGFTPGPNAIAEILAHPAVPRQTPNLRELNVWFDSAGKFVQLRFEYFQPGAGQSTDRAFAAEQLGKAISAVGIKAERVTPA